MKSLASLRKEFYEFWFSTNMLYEDWAKKQGLTSNSLLILAVVCELPACTQQQICEKLLLPKQTVNSILNGFEKQGCLKRVTAKEDKRCKVIVLTEQGRQMADKVLTKLARLEEDAFLQMSKKERRELQNSMARFLQRLKSVFQAGEKR